MQLDFYKVNAFTDRFDGGNPAGVMPLTEWLPDDLMQRVAKENGYSETAFTVKKDGCYDLRWFTPGCEVDLCGHATLATAFVLKKFYNAKNEDLNFFTKSGKITVHSEEGLFTLKMPVNKLSKIEPDSNVIKALGGVVPIESFIADDVMLVYDSEEVVGDMKPDFKFLRNSLKARGIIVTAKSGINRIDFVSRWFGGSDVGIDEDPVTGSAHCSLIPYWSKELGKSKLKAKQISERGGEMFCEFMEDSVFVSGKAVLVIKGSIFV